MENLTKNKLSYFIEKLIGHFVTKDWEKLCDLTTTEAVRSVIFTQGDKGQRFDDYSELLIQQIFQPTTQSERRVKLVIDNKGWGGADYNLIGADFLPVPSATEKTIYVQVHLKKSIVGITRELIRSYNYGSVNGFINATDIGGNSILPSGTMWDPSVLDAPVFRTKFESIEFCNYAAKCIEPNCRFVVWGKR